MARAKQQRRRYRASKLQRRQLASQATWLSEPATHSSLHNASSGAMGGGGGSGMGGGKGGSGTGGAGGSGTGGTGGGNGGSGTGGAGGSGTGGTGGSGTGGSGTGGSGTGGSGTGGSGTGGSGGSGTGGTGVGGGSGTGGTGGSGGSRSTESWVVPDDVDVFKVILFSSKRDVCRPDHPGLARSMVFDHWNIPLAVEAEPRPHLSTRPSGRAARVTRVRRPGAWRAYGHCRHSVPQRSCSSAGGLAGRCRAEA
jgi:hypothetical protein